MLTLGGFGEVWKGIWTMLPGRYVAIKKIKLLENAMNQFRAVNQQENTKTLPSKKSKLFPSPLSLSNMKKINL